MWFSERAILFADARSAAIAVYRGQGPGAVLLRFASADLDERPGASGLRETLEAAREALGRLGRDLNASRSGAALALPIGATFPNVLESSLVAGGAGQVEALDVARFRLAPLLPFPIAQAEVRVEPLTAGRGPVLAQAIPRSTAETAENFMTSLGYRQPVVTSTLSAALRGLTPEPQVADLILGDVAFALATRSASGAIDAIHLRLLAPGDDRAQRSMAEALRAVSPAAIRVAGEDPRLMQSGADIPVRAAFAGRLPSAPMDAYRFPFLGVFATSAA